MAGYIATGLDVNNRAGNVAIHLRDALDDAAAFKAWLDTKTDGVLLAAPFSLPQADIDTIRSAMSDLNQLNTIYTGAANLSVAKDFRTFAKLLTGAI
jgi:hypothetical protein